MCRFTNEIAFAVLHPQYKLDYFKELNWPRTWQETARALVEEEYQHNYAGRFNLPEPQQQADGHRDGSPAHEQNHGDNDGADAWLDSDSDSDEEVSFSFNYACTLRGSHPNPDAGYLFNS